eukprot:49649-Eustigmatos_ZCMA.PRE.1
MHGGRTCLRAWISAPNIKGRGCVSTAKVTRRCHSKACFVHRPFCGRHNACSMSAQSQSND